MPSGQTALTHYGRYRGMEIAVAEGDILGTGVECITVSGDSQGKMGGGISGAVRAVAGPEIEREAEGLAPVRLGSAVMLAPRNLAASGIKGIAYAAVMSNPIDATSADVVRRAALASLGEANRKGFSSVAIPLIGGRSWTASASRVGKRGGRGIARLRRRRPIRQKD